MLRVLYGFLVMSLISLCTYSSAQALSSAVSPVPSQHPDNSVVYKNTDIGCAFDRAAVFYNNEGGTAMGAIIDENGNPDSSCLGFAFVAADFGSASIWASNDGTNWVCISGPCP